MAGKVVNVKLCGSHQHHFGLIAKAPGCATVHALNVARKQSNLLTIILNNGDNI